MSGCPWVARLCRLQEQTARHRPALTCTLAWVLPSQPIGGLWMAKVGPERTDPVGKHPYQVLSSFCLLIISTEQPLQPGPCARPSHQHFPKRGTGAPGSSVWCRAHLSTPRCCCWRCCCLTPCCSLPASSTSPQQRGRRESEGRSRPARPDAACCSLASSARLGACIIFCADFMQRGELYFPSSWQPLINVNWL